MSQIKKRPKPTIVVDYSRSMVKQVMVYPSIDISSATKEEDH
jgi:hypothetical protein